MSMQHQVSLTHDVETGKLLSVYFQIRKANVAETREFAGGAAMADYNKNGELIGVEMIAPCKISVLDKIIKDEPPSIRSHAKKFIRDNTPVKMLATA